MQPRPRSETNLVYVLCRNTRNTSSYDFLLGSLVLPSVLFINQSNELTAVGLVPSRFATSVAESSPSTLCKENFGFELTVTISWDNVST